MEALICLREIEEPYIYHSLLYDSEKLSDTKYCVIADNYFIIFNSSDDVISLARIPLNLNTKLEEENNEFSVISNKFRFTFFHNDISIKKKWIELLETEINKDKKEIITNFYAEEVEIDKIISDCCSILIEKNGYKLLIYESHEHHISDVVRHIINLRFYIAKNIELQSYSILPSLNMGHILSIKGAKEDIKIIFKELDQATLWHRILRQGISFSCCKSTIFKNDLIMTEEVILVRENNKDEPIFEGIFHLSYNNCDKMYNLFLVCLYYDMILIKVENPNVILKERIDICKIDINDINLVSLNLSKDILRISFNSQCNFSLMKNNREEDIKIDELFIYDPSVISLKKFKDIIFNNLINGLEPPTDETSIFLLCFVQINNEGLTKCKCHITRHEFILSSSINMKFDLTFSENIILLDDKLSLLINLPNFDILIQSYNNNLVLNSLEEASKIRILSLNDKRTIIKLQKLIHFITTYGLRNEGIFRICGQSSKTEFLFNNLLEARDNFSINPAEYTAYDVTSCLKKCLAYLLEPLIPDELFVKFMHATHTEDKEKRKYAIKSYLKLLPKENHQVLQEIIELLFMIVEMSDFNKMNCDNLCTATTMSFISSKMEHPRESANILKCLIENFLYLFDYTEERENILKIFLKGLKNPSQIYILRTFYFNLSLRSFVKSNIQMVEENKVKINYEINLFSVSLNVIKCKTVLDIFHCLFENISYEKVSLWHILNIKNKFYKRLLYLDESIENSIVNGYKFPSTFSTYISMNKFYFQEKENMKKGLIIGYTYQCNVKIKNNKNINIKIEFPNSIKITDDKIGNELFKLKVSEINIYRSYRLSPSKIYIFCDDKEEIVVDFMDTEEFCDFLLYFDNLRSKDVTLKVAL